LYVGGVFERVTQSDGTELTVNRIASWNPLTETWHTVGGGVSGVGPFGGVQALLSTSDGELYAGGDFGVVQQAEGNVMEVERLARWDPGAERWEALPEGHGMLSVRTLSTGPDGAPYAGGYFVQPNRGEQRARVVRLNPQSEQ